MPNVLVVDDSAMDRGLAGRLLEKEGEFAVTYATNGREAIDQIRAERPDLVVSDLQMPEMNGLELVEALRRDYPSLPVILMTARGSEAIASEALRKGAAGYVPKTCLALDLPGIVGRTLTAADADRRHSRLMHALQSDQCTFRLNNDPELIEALVAHVQQLLRCLPLGDEAERLRVSMAVKQALWIAHTHGNLEIPLGDSLSDRDVRGLIVQRRDASPGCERSVLFKASINREQAAFVIEYEGPGIDITQLPANLEEMAAEHSWLSGFVLVPAVMDDVEYRGGTRQIALLKRSAAEDLDELDVSEDLSVS